MGKKSAKILIGLSALCSCVYLVALTLVPLYSTSAYTLHRELFGLHIYGAWMTYTVDENSPLSFCEKFPVFGGPGKAEGYYDSHRRKYFCSSWTVPLHSGTQRWCAEAVQWLWPDLCRGFEAAYLGGLLVMAIIGINAVILQVIVSWLLYDYVSRKPIRKSRVVARNITGCGAMCSAGALIVYGFAATYQLDYSVSRLNILKVLAGKTTATGFGVGQFMLWLGILIQFVQLFLFKHVSGGAEERLREEKEMRDLGLEMEMYRANPAYDVNGAGSLQPGPVQFSAPFMAPAPVAPTVITVQTSGAPIGGPPHDFGVAAAPTPNGAGVL